MPRNARCAGGAIATVKRKVSARGPKGGRIFQASSRRLAISDPGCAAAKAKRETAAAKYAKGGRGRGPANFAQTIEFFAEPPAAPRSILNSALPTLLSIWRRVVRPDVTANIDI